MSATSGSLELVERYEVLNIINDAIAHNALSYENCVNEIIESIARIPAADVRPVVRGKWIDDKVSFYLGCSECGCFLEYAVDTFLDNGDHYNFCPNCGADMREES